MSIKRSFQTAMMLMAVATLTNCSGNRQSNGLTESALGDMEAYEQSDVNAIEQALLW